MPRDNRCMYMAHVCFMSIVMTVWGMWECFCIAAVVKDSGVVSLGVLKYAFLCKGCDGCCVFCLFWDAWSCERV